MEKDISIGLCSSGSRLIVAIEHDGQIKSMRRKLFSQETALFPTVEKLLPPGKDLSSIKEVCALKGPGRFTGIRIALTVAGIMNALSGAEAHSATVFETLACQASESKAFHKHFPSGGKIAVLMQAFREEYFCAIYYAAVPGSLPEKNMEPVWLQRPEMEKLLRGIKEPFFCIADEEEKPGIYDLIPANAIRAAKNISKILPEYLIKAPRLYGGADLKPLYLKPAKFELDAMEKAAREKVSLK
ncbi:MAG: hypothetical protein K5838_02590 [Elusimicrobiales bacterium]|nr:hypothetical protein [Elusimicrobiales bacterium]